MSVTRDALVGTWRLVDASSRTADGEVSETPYGNRPTGLLIYTPDGSMAAVISYGGRPLLSADRVAAPAAERAEAFATSFAYGGRYTIDGDRLVHHVEVASVENWVGTDLVRMAELGEGRLTLTTPALLVGGKPRVSELVWQRSAV